MVEWCRNMHAHGRRRNMHVSTASSTDNLAKSVLGRTSRVPSGIIVRYIRDELKDGLLAVKRPAHEK